MDLKNQFIRGKMFDPRNLKGNYRVKMCSGSPMMVHFMNLLGDCKVFERRGDRVFGHNVLGGFITWGYFVVGRSICQTTGLEVVEINYNLDKNLFSRNIRDHIREVASGTYIGKFNLERKDGKLVFLGHFTLTKT
ncbi:MAG: hypothetical protein HY813_02050 [Candidatus Portnoybacteria bacterium]|nr:hypothetical protein [Candidatus Portnoybacteria bacterium]